MANPIPLQVEFNGMRQDEPRDSLPNSALWNCVDFIPFKLAAPLQKRGGWTYASPALGTTTYVQGLVRTPDYGAGAFNLAVTSDGHVYKFTDNTDSDIGTAFAVAQNPFVHRSGANWMVVIPAADGTTAPKSYDGTTFQTLAGTPPKAIYGATWEDYALLANGTVGSTRYVGRLWFGPVGDAAGTWDTTNSWWDFNQPIVGVAVIRNGIFVFHPRSTSRLRGDTPPTSTTVSNLIEDHPFSGDSAVGCLDARSICHYGDNLIWADFTGVYMTDGVAIKNLTSEGGISAYWRGNLVNYTTGYTVAAGVYKDVYVVSILDASRTFVDCLCYDLLRGIWYRFSHMPGLCFMHIPGVTADKTYMGLASAGRVASIENVFHDQNASDADGTAIQPYFETGIYRGWQRLHRRWIPSYAIQTWLRMWLNYELVDGGSTPTITVSYCKDATDPENVTYTALSRTFPASTLTSRIRRDLGFRARGLALKVAQTNASTDTMIRALEADYYPLESSRLEQ